jgi:hypothetical protein
MDLREVDLGGIGFIWLRIGTLWQAVVSAVMNLQVLAPWS